MGTVGACRICVVNDEWLFGFQTSAQQNLLPMPRFQHIQIEAQMRMEKPLLEKRGFASGLDADEDDGLHSFPSVATATNRLSPNSQQ